MYTVNRIIIDQDHFHNLPMFMFQGLLNQLPPAQAQQRLHLAARSQADLLKLLALISLVALLSPVSLPSLVDLHSMVVLLMPVARLRPVIHRRPQQHLIEGQCQSLFFVLTRKSQQL